MPLGINTPRDECPVGSMPLGYQCPEGTMPLGLSLWDQSPMDTPPPQSRLLAYMSYGKWYQLLIGIANVTKFKREIQLLLQILKKLKKLIRK